MMWKIIIAIVAVIGVVVLLKKLPVSITKFLVTLLVMGLVAASICYAYLYATQEFGSGR